MERYKPLIVVVCFATLIAFVFSHTSSWMQVFMGMFFILLSMFKFFNLKGFVEGFSTYDLVAKHVPAYGYLYPLAELGLGLTYLSNMLLREALMSTIFLMIVSGAGVADALRRNQKLTCACMGTALNVPLSTVSAVENLGMALMATYLLSK